MPDGPLAGIRVLGGQKTELEGPFPPVGQSYLENRMINAKSLFRFVRLGLVPIVLVTGTPAPGAVKRTKGIFKSGVLRGEIVGPSGKPVANATVALEQAKGKILAWAKTGTDGKYFIPADPKFALNLRPSHCRGLLEECVRAASDAAMDVVRIAGNTLLNPGNTVRTGAVAVASGTPGQDVAAGTEASIPTAGVLPGQVGQAAGGAATNRALLGLPKGFVPPPCAHGQADLLIAAPGFKEACVKDAAYWLDPPVVNKAEPIGVQAWMQTITLATATGKKKCKVQPRAVTLSDLTVQPALLPVGGKMDIKVKLHTPDPIICQEIRIFARLTPGNTVVELGPIAGQKDTYGASMPLNRKAHVGVSRLSVGALRAQPIEVRLNNKKADPLIAFVKRTDDMDGSKPYGYDPFVMASVNRLDARVIILAPHRH